MHCARTTLALAATAVAAVTLTGCADDLRSGTASSEASASASFPSESTQSHQSEPTPVTTSPSPSNPGVPTPETTDDFEVDMERYWPGFQDSDSETTQWVIDKICDTTMDNGIADLYTTDTENILWSDFNSGVRSLGTRGTENWMIPQVIVHHECPWRTEQVQAVVKFESVHQREREAEDASESARDSKG